LPWETIVKNALFPDFANLDIVIFGQINGCDDIFTPNYR